MKAILLGATGILARASSECLLDPGREGAGAGTAAQRREPPEAADLVAPDLLDLAPGRRRSPAMTPASSAWGSPRPGWARPRPAHHPGPHGAGGRGLLARLNPGMTFTYVSGAGTDASERGRAMWAGSRAKPRTPSSPALPAGVHVPARPHRALPRDPLPDPELPVAYAVLSRLFPLLRLLFPDQMTTTERMGRAMLSAARRGRRRESWKYAGRQPPSPREAGEARQRRNRSRTPPASHLELVLGCSSKSSCCTPRRKDAQPARALPPGCNPRLTRVQLPPQHPSHPDSREGRSLRSVRVG